MKLRFAIVGLVALSGAALTTEMASAMPLAPLEQSSNVENVALVCGPRGCVRTAPVYRRYGYAVRPYGYGVRRGYAVRRGYGYRRGYRRW
jgi:hypothetical protein